MPTYKAWRTGEVVELDEEEFRFPLSGEKILLKVRAPVAKKIKTD